VTKGVRFQGNVDVGDPLSLARKYDAELIDELVFYDITASAESRRSVIEVIEATSDQIFIPFTVGGGVQELADFDRLLRAGADKISVNSGAIQNHSLIRFCRGSVRFTMRRSLRGWETRRPRPQRVRGDQSWWTPRHRARPSRMVGEGERLGAGEIVVNSMDADGTRSGFDLEMLRAVRQACSIPVVASGGAGMPEHFALGS
jgi:imidazole glycerol-phosphate synthase subunit HisF